MATSMAVDSGCGSSSGEEFRPPIDADRNQESKPLASVPNLNSQEMADGFESKFRKVITIVEDVQKLISDSSVIVWNRHQCKRIADRLSDIAKILKWMVRDGNSVASEASSGGGRLSVGEEPVDELLNMVEKGEGIISESQGITNLICRTNNPEAFAEFHEELNNAVTKLGFQGMEDAIELTSGMEQMDMLKEDAEADKKEMHEIRLPIGLKHREEVAQVFSEKTSDVDLKKLVEADNSKKLPSYLTIAESQLVFEGPDLVRKYVRQSTRDRENEVGWARVRSGKWLDFDFAIKEFDCGNVDWNQKQLLMEVGSLIELQHPHVVRLVGFGQDGGKSVFVMELMDGDLRNFMKTKLKSSPQPDKPFTGSEELDVLDVITQIAKGMYFIHTKGFAHGDLKCSNIVVKKKGQFLEVKIADLRGSQKRGEWNPEAFKKASETRRPRWTAPEAIDHDGQDIDEPWEFLKRMDIYSFGMTCYEIVTGKYPFDGERDEVALVKRIKEGARPELPETVDERLKGLITSCWDEDPEKRPSFEEICQFLDFIKSKASAVEKDHSCKVGWVSVMLNQFTDRFRTFMLGQGNEQSESCRVLNSTTTLRPEDLRIPEYLKIEPEQLTRGGPIGSGASSRVFKTTWLGCTFAEKKLRWKKSQCAAIVQQEIESLIRVSRHPCMVQMVGLSVNSDGECSIIMEYMDGNLRNLIETRMKKRKGNETRKGPFSLHEVVCIISVIALGMAYLHSRGLVHGDLKPQNVLAQEYSGIIDVKIADFGLSTLEESLDQSSSTQSNMDNYYMDWGTGFYRAPEMLSIDKKGPKEDLSKLGLPSESSKPDVQALKATEVYSFAMTCYEVLTGNRPFFDRPSYEGSRKAYHAEVRKGIRPTWPINSDPEPKSLQELKSLVEQCWVTNPQQRLTFDDICKALKLIKFNLPAEPHEVRVSGHFIDVA